MEERWKQHIRESNREGGWEWNTPLGNAIKKYGKDSFEVFVLEECSSETEMKQKEIWLIRERKSLASETGYNLTLGGDGRLGYKLSEETKRKIGEGNFGKIMSDDARAKMSIAAKKRCVGKPSPMDGKKHTDDSLKKISESSKGRVFSEESRRKKSESLKAYYQNKKLLNNGIQT